MNSSLIGKTINNYDFLELIGQGGFSYVYKVKSNKYDELFVAKTINEDSKTLNNSHKTFFTELSTLMKLDHNNIIRIYDYFSYENIFILIMEYCPGGNLYDKIFEKGILNLKSFLIIANQICNALFHMHQKGFSHGDIKPQNILFDKFNRIKLCDFGLSLNSYEKKIHVRGTIPYMSPEVHRKECIDFFSADIWALGITFYFMLTSRLPFLFNDFKKYLKKESYLFLNFTKEIPNNIKQIIKGMLNLNPSSRTTIHELKEILNILLINSIELKNSISNNFFGFSSSLNIIKNKKDSLNYYKRKSILFRPTFI